MGLNLGIPCRHYFQVLTRLQDLKFSDTSSVSASSICLSTPNPIQSWYQNPGLDLHSVAVVGLDWSVPRYEKLAGSEVGHTQALSNPFDGITTSAIKRQGPSGTETLSSWLVYHEVQALVRPMLSGIQTRDTVT